MTEYPVQCFDNNGEPYGRYCNPYSDSGSGFLAEYLAFEHENERREDLPFPSGTIGKTYERDQVEVVWQYHTPNMEGVWSYYKPSMGETNWETGYVREYSHNNIEEFKQKHPKCGTRQIFRLLPQLVEKEPETVDNDLYFDIAEIGQDSIVIQDPDRFNKLFFQTTSNEKIAKLKKKHHSQVQFDALQFIRDLKKKGYVITKLDTSI